MLDVRAKRPGGLQVPADPLRAELGAERARFLRLPPAFCDGRALPDTLDLAGETRVAFGWLTPRAWDHARERLRFELVRNQLVLVRVPGRGPLEAPAEVCGLPRFDEQARWVFDRCAGGWGAAVVRDAAYLNARFPTAGPRRRGTRGPVRLGVRDGEGLLRGYAVLVPGRAPRRLSVGRWARVLWIADWLVPHEESEVARLLHDAVLALARARRVAAVLAVAPEWSRHFERLQAWDWIAEPSDRLLAVRSASPVHDMHWLRDHWWFQAAETHWI